MVREIAGRHRDWRSGDRLVQIVATMTNGSLTGSDVLIHINNFKVSSPRPCRWVLVVEGVMTPTYFIS